MKNKFFIPCLLLCSSLSAEGVSVTQCLNEKSIQTYFPPVFEGSDRLTQIQTLFPEIDEMY